MVEGLFFLEKMQQSPAEEKEGNSWETKKNNREGGILCSYLELCQNICARGQFA